MNYRPILLAGLIAALAALIVSWSDPQTRLRPPSVRTASVDAGYSAESASLVQTDASGEVLYRISAARITQPRPDADIVMQSPRIAYASAAQGAWTLTAAKGQLPADTHELALSGAVHAQGHRPGSDAPMEIHTEQLQLDLQHQSARSAEPVLLSWRGATLSGRGMEFDLKGTRLRLESEVHGEIPARSTK